MEEVTINSEMGKLEGVYHQGPSIESPVVLILAGHPKKKYDMNHGVINELYELFVSSGFSVLKINYRGVGRSEGEFDKTGEGEAIDATMALDWLHSKNLEAKDYWMVGHSFGSMTAMQLVIRRPEIEQYILISPTCGKKEYGFVVPFYAAGLIVSEAREDKTSEADLEKFVSKIRSKNNGNELEVEIIAGADHDFVKKRKQMIKRVEEFVKKTSIKNMSKIHKVKRDRRRRRKKKVMDDESQAIYSPPIHKIDFD